MTAFQDLVTSLGAVYLQDPLDPAGYVLSGSNITHIVNLIDSVQVAKAGTNTIQLGTICSQPSFAYNPEATSSNVRIRRTAYTAVTACLEADFTLFFITEPTASASHTVLFSYGDAPPSTSPFIAVRLEHNGSSQTLQLEKDKNQTITNLLKEAAGISLTHHVYEIVCSNTDYEMFVDGTSVDSGTWSNSAEAWEDPLSVFQSGANGRTPDSSSVTHEQAQMVLFPSILSSGDRDTVRDALTYIMCNGHPPVLTRRYPPPHIGAP